MSRPDDNTTVETAKAGGWAGGRAKTWAAAVLGLLIAGTRISAASPFDQAGSGMLRIPSQSTAAYLIGCVPPSGLDAPDDIGPPVESPAAPPSDDRNFHLLAGGTYAASQRTFAFEASFEARLSTHFSIEAAYNNEGHLQDHHRDSLAAELFANYRLFDDRIRIRTGIGPEVYFDTQTANNAQGNLDAHGIGLLATLAAELELGYGLFAEGRINGSVTQNDFSSGQALFGLGYHLGPPDPPQADPDARRDLIVVALGGQSIRNSFNSERGTAVMVGVGRQAIYRSVGAMLSYLRLGSLNGRQGVALQPSVEERYFRDTIGLGLFLGPYVYSDSPGVHVGISGLVAAKIGWSVIASAEVILEVMREFGHQDYDVVLAGVGGRF